MKPILYAPDEENFTSQGLGVLSDAISVYVEEERNGMYELVMKYPFDGVHFHDIKHSCVIKALPYEGANLQLFRVYKITSPMNKQCTVYAEHISYQLNYIPVVPFTATSCGDALAGMKNNAAQTCPFTFWTDIVSGATYSQLEPQNIKSRLLGEQGSVLDVYGGEYEWDNYTVKLHANRGWDRDVTLRYGKNITDITQEENISNTYTGVVGYWTGQVIDNNAKAYIQGQIDVLETSIGQIQQKIEAQTTVVNNRKTAYQNAVAEYGKDSAQAKKKKTSWNNAKAKLKELNAQLEEEQMWLEHYQKELQSVEGTKFDKCVYTSVRTIATDEEFPYTRIKMVDLSQELEEEPSVTTLNQALTAWIERNDIGSPKVSLKVNFVAMWDTEEYKEIAPLERVRLCDTVMVQFERLNVSVAAKVRKYKFNVLLERYDSIELGDARPTLSSNIVDSNKYILEALARTPTASWAQADIERATALLQGGYGGYVVYNTNANGQPEEILIMNTPDVATATTVIRMNKNGIGFSLTGYEGPYRTAWTIDSHFIADFITAGELNANIIHAGIISDYHNSTYAITSDTSVQTGKGYYTRWNDGTAQSPKWVYQLVSNPTGNPHALGYYECTHPANTNFWNLNTGEFQLMSTVKVGNETLEQFVADHSTQLTQENVFNALTKNGTKQGIIMDSYGNLYINASYLNSNTIAGNNLISQQAEDSSGGYSMRKRSVIRNGDIAIEVYNSSEGWITAGRMHTNSFIISADGNNRSGIEIFSDLDMDLIATDKLWLESMGSGDGKGVYSDSIATKTISSAGVTVKVHPNGALGISSSSRRYKHDIKALDGDLDPHKILDVEVIQFKYKPEYCEDPADELKDVPGFIAEQVEEVYPAAVCYMPDENGEMKCETWDEKKMIPPMLALIQEQDKRIKELENKLNNITLWRG